MACGDPPAAADADADATSDVPSDTAAATSCPGRAPLNTVFFGDLHVHTALSLDANLQGTRLTPRDAYRFARGETVGLPPYVDDVPLRNAQLARPLDFVAVTDHAEFLGAVSLCNDAGSDVYDHPQCVLIRDDPDQAFVVINSFLAFPEASAGQPPLCGDAGACDDANTSVWQEVIAAANTHNDPCSFTAFVGYEWSANPGASNLHRNVIFRGNDLPTTPASYFEAAYPSDLWAALRQDCIDTGGDCDALVIPHNSNLSTGKMFRSTAGTGQPLTAAAAGEQAALEPLVEIMQHKGDSECHPMSPLADEECSFEKMPYNNLASANLDVVGTPSAIDFVRDVWADGLGLAVELGTNPYTFGVIASTDTHLGTPGAVDEDGYAGHGGAGTAHRDALPVGLVDNVAFNPGGLAAVWAEENTRDAIFAALKRRETYGTSGPRIALRFFGGPDLAGDLCASPELVATGYATGVPMGGTLASPERAPTFVVSASRDPDTAATDLDRLQIIKVWREGGEAKSRTIDVTPARDVSIDADTCEASGEGAPTLCATWTDDDFEVGQGALYYARVLATPTCRWSKLACLEAGVDCAQPVAEGFDGCCDERFATTLRERAWSSPIWSTF